jgi:hypothetical protein
VGRGGHAGRLGEIERQADLVALDRLDLAQRQVMGLALAVAALPVVARQPDPVAFDPVDRSDLLAVGADHLHPLADLRGEAAPLTGFELLLLAHRVSLAPCLTRLIVAALLAGLRVVGMLAHGRSPWGADRERGRPGPRQPYTPVTPDPRIFAAQPIAAGPRLRPLPPPFRDKPIVPSFTARAPSRRADKCAILTVRTSES